MKKIPIIGLTILMMLTMLFSFGCGDESEAVAPPTHDPIGEIIKTMTLTEKIGQMVMIGVQGTALDEDSIYMLRQFHFGGVIFFQRNLESIEQTKRFINHIQRRADEKVPMFFAIDEEGGSVSRLGHLIGSAPSEQEIGLSEEPQSARHWALETAKSLQSIGFNVNFAPVADVGKDPRDFSGDPKIAAEFVNNAAQGYEDGGVIYCLKHLPGIGRGIIDSHDEISAIDVPFEELRKVDLMPFQKIIDTHPHDRFMIMATHIVFPAIDPDNSASMSYDVLTGLLRERLGFDGIIITDDLEMGAAANNNTFRKMGVKAIKAGADIALVCHEYSHEQDVYLGLLDAVEHGEISEERIDESVRRILRAKLNNLAVNGAQ